MQMMMLHEQGFHKSVMSGMTWQRDWTDADQPILSLVDTVLTGQATGEEQMAVQFDRAPATSGKSLPCAYVSCADVCNELMSATC